jgi:HlyD family secretion protein
MTVKWRRFVLWGVLILTLLAGLTYAFLPQPVPVDVVRIERGPMFVTVDEEGETRVRDVFVLSAPVGGRLRRIELGVGDGVISGRTVVAQIEPADPGFLNERSESVAQAAVRAAESALELARAELDEAGAELEFASAELERARQLIRKGTISRRAFDEAERTFKTRRAVVATAQARLRMREFELEQAHARLVSPVETQTLHGRCECVPITAPVGGRILRLLRESEGVVQAGDPLVEIGDLRDLEIVTDLLSSEAVKVEPGQKAIIDEWGGGAPLAGVVRSVEPYGFTKVSALGIEEQRVNVIIDLADPPARWQRLGHGYRVEVRIVL